MRCASLRSSILCLLLLVISPVLNPTFLHAQSRSRIHQAIDTNEVVRLSHSTHPLALPQNDLGRVDGNLRMDRMVLVLKPGPEQETAMRRTIDDLHNPESSLHRKWLTPEQFGEKFGPSDEDLSQVTGWLQQQGFRVNTVGRGKQFIEFSGNVAQVENAFRTEIHHYQVKGERHIANATDIAIPTALAPVVHGVLSLHDFRRKPAHGDTYQVHRDPETGNLVPDFTLNTRRGTFHFTAPGDFARIYNTQPLLEEKINGTGVSIAIVGRTNIQLSDVQTFRKIFGLPAKDPIFIFNGGDPGIVDPGNEVEAAIDVEWSGAAAPNATIKFVVTGSTFSADGVDLSIMYIIDNVVAPIMSASFSSCEAALGAAGNAFFNNLYEQAAAEGITVLTSSGDTGPAACDNTVETGPTNFANASGLASTPFNVAVGGTEFDENGFDSNYWLATNRPDLSSAIGYIPETAWNESCDPTVDVNHCFGTGRWFLSAGGGGPSSCVQSAVVNNHFVCQAGYPKPSWQAGIGVPSDGVRDLPDVSLNSAANHDGTLLCLEGSCQTAVVNGQTVLQNATVVGGTSVAAPSMAGLLALIEQKNGKFQGQANFNFYKLAAADKLSNCNATNLTNPFQPGTCSFHDVTKGNNAVPDLPGEPATTGYDLSTGLGSVNMANVVARWNVVSKLASVTQIATNSITAQHGTPVPINLMVKPKSGSGAPSGDIDVITDRFGSVFAGSLTNGSLATGLADLPGGFYTAKAHYSGDAMFKPSDSLPFAVNITPENSSVSLQGFELNFAGITTSLSNPLWYGQPAGFQIQVSGKSGQGSPTGTLTLRDGKTVLGTFAMEQTGRQFIEVDGLPGSTGMLVGNHSFTLSYNGDNSFLPAVSPAFAVKVIKRPMQTHVAPLQTSVTEGAPVQLVLIAPGTGVLEFSGGVEPPTGTVRLLDNGKAISGRLPLVNSGPAGLLSQAVFTTSSLSAGTHSLTASYSGDSNYAANDGKNAVFATDFVVTVNAPTGKVPQITILPSASTITIGQTVSYTVHVRPPASGGPMPTGTISTVAPINNKLDGPIQLVNGDATSFVTFAGAGNFHITASYSGDANYAPFNSQVVVTQVNRGTPKLILKASAAIVAANTQTSLNATVIGAPNNPIISLNPGPSGTVQFFDSVNGGPVQPLSSLEPLTIGNGGNSTFSWPVVLPTGTNVITVQYDGDRNWAPETSTPVTVTVQ